MSRKSGIIVFFKQKTAYEIVSRDWSSDVCSSDLTRGRREKDAEYDRSETREQKPPLVLDLFAHADCHDDFENAGPDRPDRDVEQQREGGHARSKQGQKTYADSQQALQ